MRINGEPAKDVNVMFTPVAPIAGVTEPLSPAAVTGEDGSFRLMSFKPGDGAPAGDYRVTVIYPMNRFSKYLSGIDRLQGKFANPKTSGLTARVEPKSNDLPSFDLKADVLPQQSVADPVKVFDQMRLVAKRLAKSLEGVLVDDNRRPLDDAALSAIRSQVQTTAAALRAAHIEPGGTRALRLFG